MSPTPDEPTLLRLGEFEGASSTVTPAADLDWLVRSVLFNPSKIVLIVTPLSAASHLRLANLLIGEWGMEWPIRLVLPVPGF